jgi:hypothetical protein
MPLPGKDFYGVQVWIQASGTGASGDPFVPTHWAKLPHNGGVTIGDVNLNAGTNTIGNVGVNASTNNIGNVGIIPLASGGLLTYRNLDLGSGVNIKATNGQLHGYYMYNGNASGTRYVNFYNKATTPEVGVDVPQVTVPLPMGAAANCSFTDGIFFYNGLGVGATTGIGDTASGVPNANDIIVNIFYK